MPAPLRLKPAEEVRSGEAAFVRKFPDPLFVLSVLPSEGRPALSSRETFETSSAVGPSAIRRVDGEVWVAPVRKHQGAGRTVWMGRDASCDIVLPFQVVSKAHCGIRPAASGGLELVDVGSRNGTRVNGVVLTANVAVPLQEGAELAISGLRLLFFRPPGAFKFLQELANRALGKP